MPSPIHVLLAAPTKQLLLDLLRSNSRLSVSYVPCQSESEIVEQAANAEILVTRYQNMVGPTVFEAATHLRLLVQGTSGLDNIDRDAAAQYQVEVVGTPGHNANAVAELVIGDIIALTRTVGFYDRRLRSGAWERSDCSSRRELRGYGLGIVGLGRVGGRVARLARGFGLEPVAYDPYISDADFEQRGARKIDSLSALLERSEILTLHMPLTEETRGMIGPNELDILPENAVVINTARGPVLDSEALIQRLESGRLAGAALDVFDPEPPTHSDWPDLEQLILTPHIAGCTREAKEGAARAVYEVILEYIARRS